MEQIITPLVVSGAIMLLGMWMLRTYNDFLHKALASGCYFTTYVILACFIILQNAEFQSRMNAVRKSAGEQTPVAGQTAIARQTVAAFQSPVK